MSRNSFSDRWTTSDLICGSAAEIRAAAAEKRLAALAKPKEEPDEEYDFNTDDDVPDPHLNAGQRKSQMEADMDEDEKKQLRGGWEEFMQFETAPKASTSKRETSPLMDVRGLKKRGVIEARNAPKFGAGLVQEEVKRDLGLASISSSSGGRTLGGARPRDDQQRVTPGAQDGEWACKLCTYKNIADHGRCGESLLFWCPCL